MDFENENEKSWLHAIEEKEPKEIKERNSEQKEQGINQSEF